MRHGYLNQEGEAGEEFIRNGEWDGVASRRPDEARGA